MSDTFRTDRDGNKRKEGLHKKQKTHICRCEYCTGVTKNYICEKIAEKELKTTMTELEKFENHCKENNIKPSINNYVGYATKEYFEKCVKEKLNTTII